VLAPEATPWPPRRVDAGEDRVVVRDLPDGPPVTLVIGPDGEVCANLDPTPAELLPRTSYSPLWAAPEPSVAPWTYGSTLRDGYSWSGRIGHAGAADLAFPASIIGFAPAADVALVCLQRADKRPWPFRRRTELVLLTVHGDRISPQAVPNPEIGALCWPSRFRELAGTGALHEYLRYALRQADATEEIGVHDVRFVLRDTLTDPEIETRFRHPDFPDHEFRRIDRPFNELGNLGEGLRDMNVSLGEDIESGLLAHLVSRTTDRIVHC
jgi:hypothetical protein